MLLFLDTETRSDVSLTQGLCRYMGSDQFRVLLVTYALDDDKSQLWQPMSEALPPADLMAALLDKDTRIVAHGAHFDQRALRRSRIFGRRVNLDMNRWLCTETQGLAHSLPGGLAELCEVLEIPPAYAKKDGAKLIRLFSKPDPRTGLFANPEDHPVPWREFCEYALRDVDAMRECFKRLPKWNYPGKDWPQEPGAEYTHWLHQHRINERGMGVDRRFARQAVAMNADTKVQLAKQVHALTGGRVKAATQRDEMLAYIKDVYGIELPDLTKDTVNHFLARSYLPEEVRALLRIREQAASNTAAKYKALLQGVSADGRLRHALRFCGAPTTGRLTGRIFQPQNLKRPFAEPEEIDDNIARITEGAWDFTNRTTVLSDAVRGSIVAASEHKLVASDLSAIEARVFAWLSEDKRMLDYYRRFDSGEIKFDQYEMTYAGAFSIPPEDVTKPLRQIGKAMALGLQYGGGVSAYVTFARTVGIDLKEMSAAVEASAPPVEWNASLAKYEWAVANGWTAGLPQKTYAACEYLKNRWRDSRPSAGRFWMQLELALRLSVASAGKGFMAGPLIAIRRDGIWTRIRLPSGRFLTLLDVRDSPRGLTCTGYDEDTHTVHDYINLYGGKLSGWVTQASARDVLTASLPRIEANGFPVVLTVHDEVVTEPRDDKKFSHAKLSRLMTMGEPWTKGLPLAADGWEAKRYRK